MPALGGKPGGVPIRQMAISKIRVKLVSEAAEYVTVSHVVQRDFTLHELVEVMVPVLGTDVVRIRQMIRVGTVSTGDYRYRWEGVEVALEELEGVLEAFPRADPSRAFEPESCFLIRFRRGQETLDLPRDAAARKPLFGKQSFWDGLMELAAGAMRYRDYSHVDKADIFAMTIGPEEWSRLRALLLQLKPKSAAERVERLHPDAIELLTRR